MDRLVNTNEIADYLNVKPITIRRKAAKGEMPTIKLGNRYRFDKSQIDKWLLEGNTGNSAHILVVDDESIIGNLIRDALQTYRCQVTVALDSQEALPIISQEHFDLIFLDLLMPELDGAELFKHIRETDKDIPVVIVTGYPDSEMMVKAMEYGPFSTLKKPFVADDIQSIVRYINVRKVI